MLRLLGILTLLMGSSGCAFGIVKERIAYLERCRAWQELFSIMENEIAFQKSSLPEICNRAGTHLSGSQRLFIGRIAQAFQAGGGDTLGEVWRREAKRIFQEEPLKKEMEQEVEKLGGRLCFEDEDMQRKILQDIVNRFLKHQKEQESINKEKNKLTLCAGVMGGLFLALLLL